METPERGDDIALPDDRHDALTATSGDRADQPSRARWPSDRVAAWVFGGYVVVGFFYIIARLAPNEWFWGDDWGMLTREISGPGDLFAPQNGHWSTVPLLVFRALFAVVGLQSYVPYLGVLLVLYMTLTVLLRVVMRRAGVGPWIATVVAGTYVLFGPGYQNTLQAIQISMVGSMLLGVGHLLLADHDGPIGTRDWIGLGLGLLGVMASGVGPVLVVTVALATLLRRGLWVAAFHSLTLAAIYGIWSRLTDAGENDWTRFDLATAASWVRVGETEVFLALGRSWPVAVLLALVLVGGLLLAWGPLSFARFRVEAAAPLALLLSAVVLFSAVSTQRWFHGEGFAGESRYLSMATAFTLPALGVAAQGVVARWRSLTIPALVLFLIGVPGNIRAFEEPRVFGPQYSKTQRQLVLGAAHSPLFDEVPDETAIQPNPHGARDVTVGFLRDARRVPEPGPLPDRLQEEIRLRLTFGQRWEGSQEGLEPRVSRLECRPSQGADLSLAEGDVVGYTSAVQVVRLVDGMPAHHPVTYEAPGFRDVHAVAVVQVPELEVRIMPPRGQDTFQLCT